MTKTRAANFLIESQQLKTNEVGRRWFVKTSKAALHASYVVALHVAKNKKAHTIAETLIKPCLLDCARIILGDDACSKLKQISMSNDTVRSRI